MHACVCVFVCVFVCVCVHASMYIQRVCMCKCIWLQCHTEHM